MPITVRLAAATAGTAIALLVLGGCTTEGPTPTPTTADQAPTPTATPDPVMIPGGSAQDNKPFFDFVNKRTIAADPNAGGQAVTSALRDAGFALADMQVTVDITTVGVKADSLQWSVLMNGQCLIGQYGFAEYHSAIVPVLGTGKCLVGETRPIDW